MKNLLSMFLIAVLAITLFACASGGLGGLPDLAQKIPGTVDAVCDLYAKLKPHYPAVRQIAVGLNARGVDGFRDGDEVWKALVAFDQKAPELDRNLALLCELAGGAPVGHLIAAERTNVKKWDALSSVVIQVAGAALQMKAQGLF